MLTRTIVAVLAFLFIGIAAGAQNSARMLMYTIQNGPALIHIAVVDTPSGIRGVVTSNTPRRERAFSVSHPQFERMWRTLQSPDLEKFASGGSPSRMFDATSNYVFSIGYMPNGKKTNFVVPKARASAPLISLARQLKAYAQ